MFSDTNPFLNTYDDYTSITPKDPADVDITTADIENEAAVSYAESPLSRESSPIALADEPINPVQMLFDAGSGILNGLTNPPNTAPPPLIQHPPLFKEPTKTFCPDGTGKLCCIDEPERSKPRHIAAPYNSDPNTVDFRFTHYHRHRKQPRQDKDGVHLFDFHDCVLRTTTLCSCTNNPIC